LQNFSDSRAFRCVVAAKLPKQPLIADAKLEIANKMPVGCEFIDGTGSRQT